MSRPAIITIRSGRIAGAECAITGRRFEKYDASPQEIEELRIQCRIHTDEIYGALTQHRTDLDYSIDQLRALYVSHLEAERLRKEQQEQ